MTLAKVNIEELARRIRGKRGNRSLRDVAEEANISFSTLSRVEKGRVPDLETYTNLCAWLNVSADTFTSATVAPKSNEEKIYMHLRADPTLPADVSESLVVMIRAMIKEHSKPKKTGNSHG